MTLLGFLILLIVAAIAGALGEMIAGEKVPGGWLGSIVAGLVGVILALAPLVGPGWATGAVFGGALVIALILLLFAKGRIDRMRKAIKP